MVFGVQGTNSQKSILFKLRDILKVGNTVAVTFTVADQVHILVTVSYSTSVLVAPPVTLQVKVILLAKAVFIATKATKEAQATIFLKFVFINNIIKK